MHDEFREDEIVRKVGGRFKLSTLVQKRMVALNRGARPLVELQTKDLMQVVVAEIMQDKIYLDTSGTVKIVADESETIDALEALFAEDDGPGIPEEDRTRVLDPFVRISDSVSGVGLGLSIVRRIVEQHAGFVRISDSPLGGCRVTTAWSETTDD